MTPDIAYVDSSTREVVREGRDLTLLFCDRFFQAFPDMVFYPQDGTPRSLPYWDFFDDAARVSIPWRGIGRFSGVMKDPNGGGLTIPATGRDFNFIGIDRYVLTDDWRIQRIDTDWDMLGGLNQLFNLPDLMNASGFSARALRTLLKAAVPAARAVGAL